MITQQTLHHTLERVLEAEDSDSCVLAYDKATMNQVQEAKDLGYLKGNGFQQFGTRVDLQHYYVTSKGYHFMNTLVGETIEKERRG